MQEVFLYNDIFKFETKQTIINETKGNNVIVSVWTNSAWNPINKAKLRPVLVDQLVPAKSK